MRSNPFRFLLLATILLPACIETAEALNTVKSVPPPVERGAPTPSDRMQRSLCCVDVPTQGWVAGMQMEGTEPLCVQPRVGQMQCAAGTYEVDCGSQLWHLDAIGPLWECH